MFTAPTEFGLAAQARNAYLELVQVFPLASIKSDQHLAAAQSVMDQLLARPKLSGGAELYLDALGDLVAAYEDRHHPLEPAADADLLRHLLEAREITQTQLCCETGLAKSTISEVLSGKRPFSRQMIRKLADYFQVDLAVLAANL